LLEIRKAHFVRNLLEHLSNLTRAGIKPVARKMHLARHVDGHQPLYDREK
jgi:hypothetical protein